MKNRQVTGLVTLLIVLSISIFTYKVTVLSLPVDVDTKVNTWDVEVSIEFRAQGAPAKVSLYLPQTEGRFELYDERFVSGDYGLAIRRSNNNRRAVWTTRKATGRQFLLYRASLRPLSAAQATTLIHEPKLSPPELSDAQLVAANHVLESVRKRSTDVDTMVSLLLTELANPTQSDNIQLLFDDGDSLLQRARIATQVLALANIPARVVNGVKLQALARQVDRTHWLEVYDGGRWQTYDANDGNREFPENIMAWWRDAKAFATVEGGDRVKVRVSSTLNAQSALHSGEAGLGNSTLLSYSLLSLPIQTQAVYHLLLLVPVGVFLLVIMRNVVGIKTFGTFMPVLMALAFRETQLWLGVGLFILLVGLGLAIRFYFDRLKLLLVPRLASVLIVVILLMAAISVLSYKLGLPSGLSIALFPMVIMTMTIERMSIVWEERGAMEALQQGAGSLLVASVAYLVMNIDNLSHFIFLYPEFLLLLLALTILLGRYSGYRLSELIRFRTFQRNA